jgi:type II secretory pathway pseudopilin PulG
MKARRTLAFTLIELLTVIAITALLLTIIVVPVIQSFSITRTAQAFGEAQDRARIMTDRIAREIGDAVGVRDLSSNFLADIYEITSGGNGVVQTSVPANTVAVVVPLVNPDGSQNSNLGECEVLLPYSKLDIMEPSQGQPDPTLPTGVFRNPITGKIDPTLKAPKGQVLLPVAQGQTMVRYWIGLRNPVSGDAQTRVPYNEPYTGFLTAQNGNRDNLFVLYRAEVQPYVYRLPKAGTTDPSQQGKQAWRPNLFLFQSDNTSDTQIVDEDDPNFFTFIPTEDYTPGAPGSPGTLTASGQAKALRILHWQGQIAANDTTPGFWGQKAYTTLQSDVSRYDMILPVYDKASRKVANTLGVPKILPLAQFRPTRITAETVAGQTASRLGEESSSGAAIAPDVFTSQYSLWSNPVVRTYPVGYDPQSTSTVSYQVGRRDPNPEIGLALFGVPNGLSDDTVAGFELFNMDAYSYAVNTGSVYPFSQALNANNSNWLSISNVALRQVFTPYTINAVTGKIITSFNITEVGNPTVNLSSNTVFQNDGGENLPYLQTCGTSGIAYPAGTDINGNPLDPTVSSGTFSDNAFNSINERFNKLWNDYPWLRPNIDRYMDLRITPQIDGTYSPLYPDPLDQQATGFGRTLDASGHNRYSKSSIVPGTEEVIGPDELPGPHNGLAIRYTRVTQNPGPNQYTINYTDIPEPADANGNLLYSQQFVNPANPVPNPQTTYVSTDFTTAVLQPRYKAGYIKFCSDPNLPIPNGIVTVTYRFQISGRRVGSIAQVAFAQDANAGNADSFSVDYDSRQLMNVLLTVRNYPQATNVPNPQTVTLKSSANVRNYIR